ncbi:MAG: ATP-binding protein, partial [Chloroflexota bacterium]
GPLSMSIRRQVILSFLALVAWIVVVIAVIVPWTLQLVDRNGRDTLQTLEAVISLEQFQVETVRLATLAFSTQIGDVRSRETLFEQADAYEASALSFLEAHFALEEVSGVDRDEIGEDGEHGEAAFRKRFDEVVTISRELLEEKTSVPVSIANRNRLTTELELLVADFIVATDEDIVAERDLLVASLNSATETSSRLRAFSAIGLSIAALLGIGLALWLARSITSPLERLQDTANQLGEGSLETPIEPDAYAGELHDFALAFEQMVTRVREVISARERAQAEIEAQDKFLRQVIDTIPSSIFVRDYDGNYILANAAAALSYNTSVEDLIGKSDHDFHPNKGRIDHYLKEDRRIIDTGDATFRAENTIYDISLDSNRYTDVIKVPLTNLEGNFDRILVVMTDVTERVQHERDLAEARDAAQEASRLKSEFLATMSHELRTPLNAVIGFSGIMLEGMGGEIDDAARGMVQAIYDSSTNLLKIINDILDIAKIEAGRMEIIKHPFTVEATAASLYSRMRVLADSKEIDFRVSVSEEVPPILIGDEQRISQVAINLISNAVKFTDRGHVYADVTWEDEQMVLRVKDTGSGIAPHAQTYIFDEFRQVDGTSRRQHGGTGLGLAIVKRLVDAMGGQITLKSKLKAGSTFTVTLPLEPTTLEETTVTE